MTDEPDWAEYDHPSPSLTISDDGLYVCAECEATTLEPCGKRACALADRRYGHVWYCPECEEHRIV